MYADGLFVKGTKVGPVFFLGVIARCFNETDEPHLHPSGNLGGPLAYNHIGL